VLHDPALLERLSGFETERFDGEDFRATRRSLDPLAASTSGGRWMPQGFAPGLYTSLLREGALAEISYHWGRLTPRPGKPAFLHRLGVSTERRLRLLRADLEKLDIDVAQYHTINYRRTQEIGAAVNFLGCDGLIVPSARWSCDNLVLFTENHPLTSRLELLWSEGDRLAGLGTGCRPFRPLRAVPTLRTEKARVQLAARFWQAPTSRPLTFRSRSPACGAGWRRP
jgi:RES domain